MNQPIIGRIVKLYDKFTWQDEEESASRLTGWKLFYFIYYFLFQVLLATCVFLSDDQDERIFLVVVLMFSAVLVVKFTYPLLKKEEIFGFIYDPIFDQSTKDRSELKSDQKIALFMQFVRAYIFMASVGCVFMNFSCLPIFSSQKRLPVFISFSLTGKYSSIIYWIAYVFVLLAIVFTYIFNFFTVLIWYQMLNYSIEYEVLGSKLRNLGVNKATNVQLKKSDQLQNQKSFQQDLIGLIKAHNHLFETTERFKSFFCTLFLAQISTGAACICITTYNLAFTQPNFSQIVVFSVSLLYAFFDIFLVMYLANEITLKSDQLSYCLFESNWIEQSESCKKCIIIMCEALKQPQQLAVLIYPLNLETFLTIINGAYSMFNVLKSFK